MVARHDDQCHHVIAMDVQSDHVAGGVMPGRSVHLQPVIANIYGTRVLYRPAQDGSLASGVGTRI